MKSVAKGSVGEDLGLRGGAVLATIKGEPFVVGGDIILRVQGVRVDEATDRARIREILNGVPPGGEIRMMSSGSAR